MGFKRTIQAVDTHCGIPLRVITGGVGHIPGAEIRALSRIDIICRCGKFKPI